MSLSPCKECKKEVSKSAWTCPHCGAKWPTTDTAKGFMVILVITIVSMVLIYQCEPSEESSAKPETVSETNAWYEGGTLHSASVKEWMAASEQNKLATAADFVATMENQGSLKPKVSNTIYSPDDLKPWAQELKVALDASYDELDPETLSMWENQKIAESAAILMTMMGWVQ